MAHVNLKPQLRVTNGALNLLASSRITTSSRAYMNLLSRLSGPNDRFATLPIIQRMTLFDLLIISTNQPGRMLVNTKSANRLCRRHISTCAAPISVKINAPMLRANTFQQLLQYLRRQCLLTSFFIEFRRVWQQHPFVSRYIIVIGFFPTNTISMRRFIFIFKGLCF